MRFRFESIKPSCVSGICRLALALVAFVPMGVSQEGVLPPLKDLGIVGDEPAEIVLKGVEFDGNTVFSDAELLELVKERLGKKVSIEELECYVYVRKPKPPR